MIFCAAKINRKVILQELRDIFLLALLGIFMTWVGLTCRNCFDNLREFWIVASFTSLMWIFLWKGNSYLTNLLTYYISWIDYPVKRFVLGLVVTIVYTFSAMFLLGAVYKWSFDLDMRQGAWYSVIITIIISLFLHGREFLSNWKQASVDAEKLKKENIQAKFESLKNQVNPHFLFNSLNALTNLVYEDQDKAVKFIKQLSEVYRYVLDTREKEVVPLDTELAFLDSYLYLQKIRFGEKLRVNISIGHANYSIAPLALQMLIENAIKHNIVSEEEPLEISITTVDEYLVVKNNLQLKTRLGEPSSGVGLENICKRYEFLSNRNVIIEKDSASFCVRLPLLSLSVQPEEEIRQTKLVNRI